jgi:hypothetical protein
MKRIHSYSFFTILAALFLFSCEKNELRLTIYDLPTDKAYARFFFLSPGTPSVMIKVNDVKLNGSNTAGSGGLFPSIVNQPDYAAVTPNASMKLSLPNIGTLNDSVVIFTGNLGLAAGKFYAVTLADTGADRTLFANETVLSPVPDSGFFYLRFINAMAKSPALSLIRIDSASATVVTRDTLVKNLEFKAASNFIKLPISGTNANIRYRMATSTGVNVGTVQTPPATASLNQRSITYYAGGFWNGTSIYVPTLSSAIFNQ